MARWVLHRSGSMGGSRMKAAKSALQLCLRSLPEGCTFQVCLPRCVVNRVPASSAHVRVFASTAQIVSFGSRFTKLFPTSKPYNRNTLRAAATHVDDMKANYGGTEIWAPLQDVFSDAADPAMPRQVLLFTDGEVKNTRSVVDLVRREASKSGVRCFAFGIGNDVSHALVDGVASSSGGTAEYIHSGERMDTKVARQLERAMDPALVNVRAALLHCATRATIAMCRNERAAACSRFVAHPAAVCWRTGSRGLGRAHALHGGRHHPQHRPARPPRSARVLLLPPAWRLAGSHRGAAWGPPIRPRVVDPTRGATGC